MTGRGESFSRLKDTINGLRIEGQVSTADDISSMLGTIVQGWANTTDAWLDHLFSGTDQGLADLDKQILGGAWADSAMSVPNNSLQDAMERIIYGRLIPAAWTDHPDVHPVIVYSNRTNETNPTSPIGVSSGLDFFIDPKDKVSVGATSGLVRSS